MRLNTNTKYRFYKIYFSSCLRRKYEHIAYGKEDNRYGTFVARFPDELNLSVELTKDICQYLPGTAGSVMHTVRR